MSSDEAEDERISDYEFSKRLVLFHLSELKRHEDAEKAFWKPKNRIRTPSPSSSSSDEEGIPFPLRQPFGVASAAKVAALPASSPSFSEGEEAAPIPFPLRRPFEAASAVKVMALPASSPSSSSEGEEAAPPLHFRSTIRRKRARIQRNMNEAYAAARRDNFHDTRKTWSVGLNPVLENHFQSWIAVNTSNTHRPETLSQSWVVSNEPGEKFRKCIDGSQLDRDHPMVVEQVHSPTVERHFRFFLFPRWGRIHCGQLQRRTLGSHVSGMFIMGLAWYHFRLSGGRENFLRSFLIWM